MCKKFAKSFEPILRFPPDRRTNEWADERKDREERTLDHPIHVGTKIFLSTIGSTSGSIVLLKYEKVLHLFTHSKLCKIYLNKKGHPPCGRVPFLPSGGWRRLGRPHRAGFARPRVRGFAPHLRGGFATSSDGRLRRPVGNFQNLISDSDLAAQKTLGYQFS